LARNRHATGIDVKLDKKHKLMQYIEHITQSHIMLLHQSLIAALATLDILNKKILYYHSCCIN